MLNIRKFAPCPLLFALTALTAAFQSTSARADGVEFQPLPIDVNARCSSLILQGTRRFAGTAFVVPKVFLSINRAGNRLFEIIPQANDEYLLRIALFIPNDPSDALSARNNSNLITHSCNLNDIRTQVARTSRANSSTNNTMLRLTALPIQQLTVRINGLDDTFVIGSNHTDILDYNGLDQIAEFTIHGRARMENILSRIRGELGLTISVDMGFAARSSSNYLSVRADTSRISADLAARFSGQVSVTHATLAAAISDSLRSMNLTVYQEGDSDAFGQLAQSLITQLGQGVFAAAPSAAPAPVEGDAPAALTEALPIPAYNVRATLNAMRDRQSLTLVYQRMGAVEQKVFTTSTILRADVSNLNHQTLMVSSERGWMQSTAIAAGREISLDVSHSIQNALQRTLTSRWYSKAGLTENFAALSSAFSTFSDADMNDVTEIETADGWVAQYLSTPPRLISMVNMFYYSPETATTRVKWGYRQWNMNYTGPAAESPVRFNSQTLPSLPLEFSFSSLGSRIFKVNELIGDHGAFTGTFDATEGKIVLHAQRDLGFMRVRNTENIPTTYQAVRDYIESRNYVNCRTCSVDNRVVHTPFQMMRRYQSQYALNIRTPETTVQLAPERTATVPVATPTVAAPAAPAASAAPTVSTLVVP